MIENVSFEKVNVTGGFWQKKQELIRHTTIRQVYDRFNETGRIDAFRCDWKEGMPNEPHIFWDSDVAKWIESVAYLSAKKREPALEALADSIIDQIEKNQGEDGYFNVYYTVVKPQRRFTNRKNHELYCAGHLIEAAVAYKRATGKDKLYRCMLKYADYIDSVFRSEESIAKFQTPGHQEIELALVRLYKESGDKKYLELSKHFIDRRGDPAEHAVIPEQDLSYGYAQDHLPVREQTEAKGHAVRLLYMLSAMADLSKEYPEDKALRHACEALFEDIVYRKMYITGGVGSNCNNEGFDERYYLPNEEAYNETCASIAMVLFAMRMQKLSDDSRYADVIEKELYNGLISGLSQDGTAFFYVNPVAVDLDASERLQGSNKTFKLPLRTRAKVFSCSCCPPNITRFVSSVGELIYTATDTGIRVNQYISSEADFDGRQLSMTTDYPTTGDVAFTYHGPRTTCGFRIPAWCRSYTVKLNGLSAESNVSNGYLYLSLGDGDTVSLSFDMAVRFVESDPRVAENAGRVAVMRGPVVYCLEAVDNDLQGGKLADLRVKTDAAPILDGDVDGIPCLILDGQRRALPQEGDFGLDRSYRLVDCALKLIPYFHFANRGESDMLVFLLKA